jgi:peptidoglycan hydrolase-like protein with peptidoglycan-binding domain
MPQCYNPMPAYPGFLIRVGARGDYVRQIQTCLNGVNNAGLSTDGIFGPLTEAAVRNHQRANNLNPDGIVGPLTWENLMRRCSGAGVAPIAPVRRADPVAQAAAVPAQAEVAPQDAALAEVVAEANADEDISSLGIEYSPNFAAKDLTQTEYIEETLGKVEPANGNDEVSVIPEDCGCKAEKTLPILAHHSHAIESALSPFSESEILIYLLMCKSRDKV